MARLDAVLFGGESVRVCSHCLFPIRWSAAAPSEPFPWSGWVHVNSQGPYCANPATLARPVR